jgi:uncharacterized membrane protein YfcA
MPQRPLSITIIAWFLILSSVWGVFSIWTTRNDPLVQQMAAASPVPASMQLASQFITTILTIIFGIGMLKGRNWGRWGFIILSLLGAALAFLISSSVAIALVSLLMTSVFAFFLFRKPANEWFAGRSA